MSKRVLALVLTIAMVCAMGITASASPTNSTADIKFTPYGGGGVVDPTDPSGPDLPDDIKALGALNIHFGTREVQLVDKVYTTDGIAPLATGLAGVAVVSPGVDTWKVQLTIGDFAQIRGQTPLAGFRISLRQEGSTVGGTGFMFNNMPAPVGDTLVQTGSLSAGGTVEIMTAANATANIVGTQFRSHILVPGNAFQPDQAVDAPRTTLTWTYVA